LAARRTRDPGARQRHRHPAQISRQAVPTVLHDQADRRGHGQGLYVLHFAYSAEEALAKLADGIRPQLIVILSDIKMPGMDGLTLLREIKKSWPDIPVMMVAACSDDECRRLAGEYSACGSSRSRSISAA
jgi:CheY-like chemotaxis protein